MSDNQAALIEAIPFLQEITNLDLLGLPSGLFEALPKPCNLKRSQGSPIWPPVLTQVLINGLLILHHKPHLVGKSGLEEKFNWLSAFIYRQTRGWDLAALARNTIEIKPTLPGEKKIGVIRNRKQISSKVQTIGEYLKDTQWAYITQAPRPQRLGCDELSLSAPIFGPAGSAGDRSPPLKPAPDLSRVSLEPTWLPPTPFSLPSTPNHSPYSYPGDVSEFETYDARALGYDPAVWPEVPDKPASRRPSLPPSLDRYSTAPYSPLNTFNDNFRLVFASIIVLFGGNPSTAGAVSPQLLTGTHQLARIEYSPTEKVEEVVVKSLPARVQQLLPLYPANVRTYHVDFPIHLPTSTEDRTYLSQEVGCDFHVKARIGLHTDSLIPPTNDTYKVISEVYFFPGAGTGTAELLQTYEESASIRRDQSGTVGSLVAHTLATPFIIKLWADMLEPSHGAIQDLTRYAIVQRITPRIGSDLSLLILYSLRQCISLEAAKIRLLMREGSNGMPITFMAKSPASDTDMDMDNYPGPSQSDGPDRSFSGTTGPTNSNHNDHNENTPNNGGGGSGRALLKYSVRRATASSTGATGPVRNIKVAARTPSSRTPTVGSTPSELISLPLTPRASPNGFTNQENVTTNSSPLLAQAANRNAVYDDTGSRGAIISLEPQPPQFNANTDINPNDWVTAAYLQSGAGSTSMFPHHLHQGWVHHSHEIERIPGNVSSIAPAYPTYQTTYDNEHLLYYGPGSSVTSWN